MASFFSRNFQRLHNNKQPATRLWNCIKNSIFLLMEMNIPKRTLTTKLHQPWITGKVKRLCRKKTRWFRKTQQTDNEKVKEKFILVKKECKAACRKARAQYLSRLSEEGNDKLLWNHVKTQRTDAVTCSFLRDANGTITDEAAVKAGIFNSQFSSVFSRPEDTEVSLLGSSSSVAPDINITVNGIEKLMSGLNPHKAAGPDEIPPKVLKELAVELAPVFSILYQASLLQGEVPQDWRTAHVTPVYKKNDPLVAANYRPVSLTSIPCKLLEHVLHSHIMNHLISHKILCENQHGFRKKRSTESQLVSFTNDLASNIDVGTQTDVVLLDFAKAFDKVNHSSLLKKLDHYGIRGQTFNWIQQFLFERTQRVILDGVLSDSAPVLSGVPQGSVLGPLLFLIYINDLPQYVSPGTQVRLFADDSAVYRRMRDENDHVVLQKDLDNLQVWEKMWSMNFHPNKCQVLNITTKRAPSINLYTIHDEIIDNVDSAVYLGVTLSNTMSWSKHIDSVCFKAQRSLNFLQRNFRNCSPTIKSKLYLTYVRPILEYCSSVWDPFTREDIARLEQVQRRAVRFVFNNYSRYQRVTPLIEDVGWASLESRRKVQKVCLLYKSIHNLVDIPSEHLTVTNSITRRSKNFYIPYARTSLLVNSFYQSSMRTWNTLPGEVRKAPTLDRLSSIGAGSGVWT